jgi:enoyl-CoA hydratase/carnithine racemase
MNDDTRRQIRIERRGHALWIWIDREERRNAINSAVIAGIHSAVETAMTDRDLRAVVLTGAGDKAFCAGADLSKGADVFQAMPDEPTTDFGRLARAVKSLGIPIIARINGDCVAGGMGLMALCDLAIAADNARFGLPEVKVGVFPMQVLVLLRGMMHSRHINELCLTGKLIPAARALEMGVVNEVSPYGELDERIEKVLANLQASSPAAVRRGKQTIFAMEMMAFHEALAFAEAQIAIASRSGDAAEGLAAFNEKRQPRWAAGDAST